MNNPFIAASKYDTSEYVTFRCSLNRAKLAKLPLEGIEDEIEGKYFSDIFSTPLIVEEIRRLSRYYRIDLSGIPDSRLPMIINEAAVSDDIRYKQLAETVLNKYGNRLGILFLTLKTGLKENRAAREDWDDSCWEYWNKVDTLILTGGLASSMLGRRFKEQIHNIFDIAGVKPYNIMLYDNGAYLGVMGVAQRLMKDNSTSLVLDLGHTNFKRAVVRKAGGVISGFSPFESLPSMYMQSRFDSEDEKRASAIKLNNYVVKAIVSSYREASVAVTLSNHILISIANYLCSGHLNSDRGGFAKLCALGTNYYKGVLEEILSGELRKDIEVTLVHDATATALYFSDVPDSVCLTLGTAFGVSFPNIKI